MILSGRVALITGGASGIGLATARRFGAQGAKLCIATRNLEKLERAVRDLQESGLDVMGRRVAVPDDDARQLVADIDRHHTAGRRLR